MGLMFQVLASGSKGNAVVVSSSRTRILFDAGLSCKELVRRMDRTQVQARRLDALVVGHEHADHVRGAGVLSRRFDLPVYINRGTLENLPAQVGRLAHTQLFQSGTVFHVGDLKIHPFALSHDACEPVGFVVENEAARLGICTDLGVATHLVRERLRGCHGLILEANHDVGLLLNGPYPPHLKQRIRSRHGHLSNDDTCELLEALYHDALKTVILAHLSETNNRPDLVRDSFERLRRHNGWDPVRFEVGSQSRPGAAVELGG